MSDEEKVDLSIEGAQSEEPEETPPPTTGPELEESSPADIRKTPDAPEEKKLGVLDKPLIIEGRRSRVKVDHFVIATPKAEKQNVEDVAGKGAGMALGDISSANEYITKSRPADLKLLHKLLYRREGQAAHATIFKRALRQFNGWWFDEKSDEWQKRVDILNKMKLADVKKLRSGVGLHHAAPTREKEAENLMNYLLNPSGKSTQAEMAKKEKKTAAKKRASKAKATPAKRSKKAANSESEQSEDEPESEDNEEDYAAPTPKKRGPPKTASPKKTAKSKAKIDSEEDSDSKSSDEGEDENDDSSVKTETKSTDEKGDVKASGEEEDKEDEEEKEAEEEEDPKRPNAALIRKAAGKLLKEFDLTQVSMRQMCDAVCEKFPDSDLVERKSFLKGVITEILQEMA
ncbi:unnamed protein product, partial [Mesorhabditis spiculigera]